MALEGPRKLENKEGYLTDRQTNVYHPENEKKSSPPASPGRKSMSPRKSNSPQRHASATGSGTAQKKPVLAKRQTINYVSQNKKLLPAR